MPDKLFALSRALLFVLPPEDAHELTLKSLEGGLYLKDRTPPDPRLTTSLAGLHFPNPIGIAAGFDKNARVPDAVLGLGCGYAEIGTVTPHPQSGNPTPRVFRLVDNRSIINRLGFNNEGHAAALARLVKRSSGGKSEDNRGGIVGVNVGANKDSPDRIADYVAGIDTFTSVASYFMVNISSPNTTGLRKLQDPASLDQLLAQIMTARSALVAAGKPSRPIFVKIAPDIGEDEIEPICAQLMAHNVDGIAVSNTTLARPGLTGTAAREAGGLSGPPLFHRSTVMLARVHQATGGKVALIGIGGIDSGETALAKITAGASLIQLYTGLIYEGPGLIGRIKQHLANAVTTSGATNLSELLGSKASEWAARPLDA